VILEAHHLKERGKYDIVTRINICMLILALIKLITSIGLILGI